MNADVFQRLSRCLEAAGVAFEVLRHEPVTTSAEAAAVRGTSLASGAKALVCKLDDRFGMIVLPADRKLAGKRLKARSIKSVRFATREEVLTLTGLTPGSIPPFGSLFGLSTWCDLSLADQPRINFNAGDHAISISMSWVDFVAVEQPELGQFADDP